MKLTELNPKFYGAGGEGISDKDGNPVPARHGVGVGFDCPAGCEHHRCFVGFKNPLDGGPPRETGGPLWDRTGDTFETLTLSPSIQRLDGCKWHGYVRNGEIVNA